MFTLIGGALTLGTFLHSGNPIFLSMAAELQREASYVRSAAQAMESVMN
jgi:hypothetical protein